VRLKTALPVLFSILLVALATTVLTISGVEATGPVYRIEREYVKVWVNKDGTIDLFYNITVSCSSGSIGILTLGMPNPFTVDYVHGSAGSPLRYEDVSKGSFYGLDIYLDQRIGPGHPTSSETFTVMANVRDMVWEDTKNRGNVGVLFTPVWWENPPAPIIDLRVQIVAPEGVAQAELKTNINAMITPTEDGISAYWERADLAPAEKVSFGISFPKEYVSNYRRAGSDIGFYAGATFAVVIAILLILLAARWIKRDVYERPRIAIEALGPARGLTAPEAAVLLGLKPTRVLTMILFGLLRKGFVEVAQSEPVVRLKRLETDPPQPSDGGGMVRATPPKRYYERLFLDAVKADGTLDERALARTYMVLRDIHGVEG